MPAALRLPTSLALSALLVLGSLSAQGPLEFVPGDVSKLSCKVVDLTSEKNTFTLVVDVRNRGRVQAEPLVFAVTAKPQGQRKQETTLAIARAHLPYAFRAGRPVKPGRTERYHLYGTMYELPRKLQVEVTRAAFFDGRLTPTPDDDEPPVRVGRITHATLDGAAGTVPVSRIEIENPVDRPVDLVLRARYSRPRDVVALVTARLDAGETKACPVEDLLGSLDWTPWGQARGAKVEEVEVVDWCYQFRQPEPAARRELLDAYVNWVAWDLPTAVRGRFVIRETHDGKEARGKGTFTLSSEGKAQIEWDGPQPQSIGTGAALRKAFDDLQRPAVGELVDANRFARLGDDLFGVSGRGWRNLANKTNRTIQGDDATGVLVQTDAEHGLPMFRVTEGRIDGNAWTTSQNLSQWTLEDRFGGYVVTQRRENQGGQVYSWEFDDLDGIPVVTRYHEVWYAAGDKPLREIELKLDQLTLEQAEDGAGGPAPPRGPGLSGLRAAWEATWAYPDEPVTLSARFEIETPATDGVWVGHKRVTGTVEIEGFRGYRVRGERWTSVDVTLDDDLPATDHPALSSAVRDRLGLWAGRDLAGRGAFDAAFAGSRIEALKRGSFPVAGGPYESVKVKKGQIVAITLTDGPERTFQFTPCGGRAVPTRIVTGEEELLATWREIDGYRVPVEFEFRRVFGKDWGTESIRLTEVTIRR